MTDNLHQLAGQMVALFRQAVPLANAEVRTTTHNVTFAAMEKQNHV